MLATVPDCARVLQPIVKFCDSRTPLRLSKQTSLWLSKSTDIYSTLQIPPTHALLRFADDGFHDGLVHQLELDHLLDLEEERLLDEDEVVGRDAEAVVVGGLQRLAVRDAAHYPTRLGSRAAWNGRWQRYQ